jgi:hypothetical protein
MPGVLLGFRYFKEGIQLEEEFKECKGCKELLPIDSFRLHKATKRRNSYRSGLCRKCESKQSMKRRTLRKEQDVEYAESLRLYERKRSLAKYGLTIEEYKFMLELQEGTCTICKTSPIENGLFSATLVVDHDHETGKVRALLCNGCNQGLGMFKDNPNILDLAAAYLRLHGKTGDA